MRRYWACLTFFIITLVACKPFCYCGETKNEFEKEINLVIRAVKGELAFDEKQALLTQNHPILLQIGDPNTKKLLNAFANLSEAARDELLKTGCLKWKYSRLDAARQQVYKDFVQLNIDFAKQQGVSLSPNFSLRALNDAEVGYAVVDIPSTTQKVISWFILWPAGQPSWVTVAGARAVGTQPYFTAHGNKLPLLKGMPDSRVR